MLLWIIGLIFLIIVAIIANRKPQKTETKSESDILEEKMAQELDEEREENLKEYKKELKEYDKEFDLKNRIATNPNIDWQTKYTVKSSLPKIVDKTVNSKTGHTAGSGLELENAQHNISLAKRQSADYKERLKDNGYGISSRYNDARDVRARTNAYIFLATAVVDAEGNYAYIDGNWKIAEEKWLSVAFADYHVCDKLSKLFKKEHRYEDASKIVHLGNFAPNADQISDKTFHNRVKRYQKLDNYAEQHADKDQSKLPSFNELSSSFDRKMDSTRFF